MTFKSHTNLDKANVSKTNNAISESIKYMSINEDNTRVIASVLKSLASKTRRKIRNKSNLVN
jgi:hypothetical protein